MACTKKNELYGDAAIDGDAGPLVDAQPDAQPDATPVGQVSVHVFVDGEPAAGITVFSNDPSGAHLVTTLSDSNGAVSFSDFPAGGSLTAAVSPFLVDASNPGDIRLSTVMGVQIGETITFGRSLKLPKNRETLAGTLSLTLPAAFPNALAYTAGIPCATGGTSPNATKVISFGEDCFPLSGAVDGVAYAADATGHIAYSTVNDVTVDGTIPNVTGSAVFPAWKSDLGTFEVQLVDSPQDELFLQPDYRGLNDGLPFKMVDQAVHELQDGAGDTVAIKLAPNFYEESAFAIGVFLGGAVQDSASVVAFREDGSPGPNQTTQKSLNLSTEVPGLISNVVATSSTPIAVTWSTSSLACKDNPEPDGLIVAVVGDTAGLSYRWAVLTAGNTASGVALPVIDPDLAATLWPEALFTQVEAGVVFKSDSALTYDDLRSKRYNLSTSDWVPATSNSTYCIAYAGVTL